MSDRWSRGFMVLMVCVLALGLTFPALAQEQETTPDEETTDEAQAEAAQKQFAGEITVTSRRLEENIQDVPIAVSVVMGDQLEDLAATTISELQGYAPNLSIYQGRNQSSTLTAFIRGIGQSDPLWGVDPGVGLYIDDVYIARAQGALLDVYDVQRVEVLRGPQGTLYGKNTIGGAIKYVSKELTDTPEGYVSITLGQYQNQDVKLGISGPLVEGKLRGGMDAFDLLRATFPAGTLSGAPKIRACELISELEPGPRGLYAGTVGYFGTGGSMDQAIAIRTLEFQDGRYAFQAGAGIVADSVPQKEHEEIVAKGAALDAALGLEVVDRAASLHESGPSATGHGVRLHEHPTRRRHAFDAGRLPGDGLPALVRFHEHAGIEVLADLYVRPHGRRHQAESDLGGQLQGGAEYHPGQQVGRGPGQSGADIGGQKTCRGHAEHARYQRNNCPYRPDEAAEHHALAAVALEDAHPLVEEHVA